MNDVVFELFEKHKSYTFVTNIKFQHYLMHQDIYLMQTDLQFRTQRFEVHKPGRLIHIFYKCCNSTSVFISYIN